MIFYPLLCPLVFHEKKYNPLNIKFPFRVKLLQESYKLMEMKKLLRGYGIREVNLLNKEIMVSTIVEESFKSSVPFWNQLGKHNEDFIFLKANRAGLLTTFLLLDRYE